MKRTLLYIAALAVMATTTFTSCVSDYSEKREAYNLPVIFSMDFSADLINMADIEIVYTGADGTNIYDTITSEMMDSFTVGAKVVPQQPDSITGALQPDIMEDDSTKLMWQQYVVMKSIPAEMNMSVRFLPKPCSEQDKDRTYYLYDKIHITVADSKHNGKDVYKIYNEATCLDWSGVRGSNVEKAISIANNAPVSIFCKTVRSSLNPDRLMTISYK